MKRGIIILFIVVIILVVAGLLSFKPISFVETRGAIIDENGEPIENAKVVILYQCVENQLVDSDFKTFGSDRIATNKNGEFSFEKRNFGFKSRLFYFECTKFIFSYKKGYCGYLKTECDNDLYDPISTKISKPKHDPDGDFYYNYYEDTGEPVDSPHSYYIYYNRSYYPAHRYLQEQRISKDEVSSSIELTKQRY